MLTVIGGSYREVCLAPEWDRFYGSGLRAAVALVEIVSEITLYTFASKSEMKLLKAHADAHEFVLHITQRGVPIEWQYDHSGGSPRLYACNQEMGRLDPPVLEKRPREHVLVYGFIESREIPQFSADCVVYDPQAGSNAIPFPSDRCNVDQLVIVLNLTEAKAIANSHKVKRASEQTPRQLAKVILKKERAEAVIVKNGVFGAHLALNNHSTHHIPALKTESYFGIGSGDVFSATFAALWMEVGCGIVESAELASAATAYYCNSGGVLPLPKDLASLEMDFDPIDLDRIKTTGLPKRAKPVYLAGPFFSLSQKWLINQARDALNDAGIEVWSPWAEAGLLSDSASSHEAKKVASTDLDGLINCGSVFACLDQMDPGTLFEVGFAVRSGMPVTVYAENVRRSDLTMLLGSDCFCSRDFATAVAHAVNTAYRL